MIIFVHDFSRFFRFSEDDLTPSNVQCKIIVDFEIAMAGVDFKLNNFSLYIVQSNLLIFCICRACGLDIEFLPVYSGLLQT